MHYILIIERILRQNSPTVQCKVTCIINVWIYSVKSIIIFYGRKKKQIELSEDFLIILIDLLLESTTLGDYRELWMSALEESLFIQTIKPLKTGFQETDPFHFTPAFWSSI